MLLSKQRPHHYISTEYGQQGSSLLYRSPPSPFSFPVNRFTSLTLFQAPPLPLPPPSSPPAPDTDEYISAPRHRHSDRCNSRAQRRQRRRPKRGGARPAPRTAQDDGRHCHRRGGGDRGRIVVARIGCRVPACPGRLLGGGRGGGGGGMLRATWVGVGGAG